MTLLNRISYYMLNLRLRRALKAVTPNKPWGVTISIQNVEFDNKFIKTRTVSSWYGNDKLSKKVGKKQIERVNKLLVIPSRKGYEAALKGRLLTTNPYPQLSIENNEFTNGYMQKSRL